MNDILKTLTIKVFDINEVVLADNIKIEDKKLSIDNNINTDAYDDLKEAKVSLLKPHERDVNVNTILDFIPISTKVYGSLGEGITHTMIGVYVLLTAREDSGKQYFNFGTCHGILKDIIVPNQIGTIKDEDYLIHIDIISKDNSKDPRKTVYNIHKLADSYIQKIRDVLKNVDATKCSESHVFHEKNNKTGKKVVMIKQIGGQGAMHDNLILPLEPSGVEQAQSIIDLNNMPVVISPNEYRDGAIRAMT